MNLLRTIRTTVTDQLQKRMWWKMALIFNLWCRGEDVFYSSPALLGVDFSVATLHRYNFTDSFQPRFLWQRLLGRTKQQLSSGSKEY